MITNIERTRIGGAIASCNPHNSGLKTVSEITTSTSTAAKIPIRVPLQATPFQITERRITY